MTKNELLKKLYEEYRLQFTGEEIVVGSGSVDAKLLLVGEAPGKDEVRLGKPFVGAAGKNLSEFLDILGIQREDIYITNAIKHRLSKVNPDTGRVVNRPAAKDEIKSNRFYLISEIEIIKPDYIVTLGNVPLRAVTEDFNASIGAVHGTKQQLNFDGMSFTLFPLYHPASVIYNSSLKSTYIEDLKKLGNIIMKRKEN